MTFAGVVPAVRFVSGRPPFASVSVGSTAKSKQNGFPDYGKEVLAKLDRQGRADDLQVQGARCGATSRRLRSRLCRGWR